MSDRKVNEQFLVLDRVSRHYERDTVKALADVSFTADKGEVVAVTGPSGCGKSTLLSLIGLLDQPTTGSVSIGGTVLASVHRPSLFRARNIGFVFQFHHMVPTMTLLENVSAPLIAAGVSRSERNERASAMLEKMRVSARSDFLPANVSGGERQRAAVARALINQPAVVLADEPTGNLDTRNGEIVVDLLVTHARSQGALVLMATHNPDIARTADRCIELLDGTIVSTGS